MRVAVVRNVLGRDRAEIRVNIRDARGLAAPRRRARAAFWRAPGPAHGVTGGELEVTVLSLDSGISGQFAVTSVVS